ncbi:MAG: ShlB/FhaC/HecB family hemolysin secretion/activation protein [Verrucomicrobiota bacterium]
MKLTITILLLGSMAAWSQQRKPDATKPPERKPVAATAPAAETVKGDATKLVAEKPLKSIVIVASPAKVVTAGRKDLKPGVTVEGPDFLKYQWDFVKALKPYLGKPLSEQSLYAMQRDIILYCRAKDHPVVDVFLAVQEIEDSIQIAVIEGKVGAVIVNNEGKKWFSDKFIKNNNHLKPGSSISERRLLNDLAWMNRNPMFREVTASYKQSSIGEGSTDLIFNVNDRFPLRPYVGYEDSLSEILGRHSLFGGFNYGNLFGLDHQLNYQYTSGFDLDRYKSHYGSYILPLPWRHTITLYGVHTEFQPDLTTLGNYIAHVNGWFYQVGGRYTLPLFDIGKYNHQLSAGYDYKKFNNDADFGGTGMFNSMATVREFVGGYSGALNDSLGELTFNGNVYYSPWHDQKMQESYTLIRNGSQLQFFLVRAEGKRVIKLPLTTDWRNNSSAKCWTVVAKGSYQYSPNVLVPSEQFGIGGFGTVRGYNERIANGDRGYSVSAELRTPFIQLSKDRSTPVATQLYGFYDRGAITVNGDLTNPHADLASVGGGINLQVTTHFQVRAEYGWQLVRDSVILTAPGADQKRSRAHISAVLSF